MTNTSANQFFVYRLVRNGVPFYIGKGSGRRGRDHLAPSGHRDNSLRSIIIRKAISSGDTLACEIVQSQMTEAEAFAEEKRLIALYGRIDIATGSLANHTDGGDGAPNLPAHVIEVLREKGRAQMSPAAREYLREIGKAQFANQSHKEKHQAACRLAQSDPIRVEKNRKRGLKQSQAPGERQRLSDASKAYNSDPENRKINSEMKKAQWQNPEWRAKVMAAQAAGRSAKAENSCANK